MTKIPNLGQTIAQFRAEKTWSQEALAASADLSVRTIQRLEEGKPAAVETVAAIARALGLDIEGLRSAALWIEAYPTMMRLPRDRIGGDIVAAVRNAEASMHNIHSDDPALRRAALAVIESARDWGDLLDGSISEGHAEDNLNELLEDLHSAGGKLFHTRLPVQSKFSDRHGDSITLDTVLFVVYPENATQILIEDDHEIALIGTAETAEVVRQHG